MTIFIETDDFPVHGRVIEPLAEYIDNSETPHFLEILGVPDGADNETISDAVRELLADGKTLPARVNYRFLAHVLENMGVSI